MALSRRLRAGLPLAAAAATLAGSTAYCASTRPRALSVSALAKAAERRGLGIAAAFTLQDYHARVPAELALDAFARPRTLAILLGSTREIWPPFLDALERDAAQLEATNPLDDFVVAAAEAVAAECVPDGVRYALYYSHELEPGRLVGMQHAAHAAGVSYYHQGVGLCVHPRYGAFHSLRALLVVDVDGADSEPVADPCSAAEVAAAEAALEAALAATADPTATNSKEELSGSYKEAWRLWQQVRKSIQVGREEWEYSDAEDEYHYTWSKTTLRRMLEERRNGRAEED